MPYRKPWMLFCAFILMMLMGHSLAYAGGKLLVFTSIVPQKYFVERIGGDRVAVSIMVTPGESPATYEPKPRQMAALSKATLYFAIGVPFESSWLNKIAAANPDMTIVHTDAGIQKYPMETHHHHGNGMKEDGHHKGESGPHADDHIIMDPHIWTSPPLVKPQAETICKALIRQDPENEAFYRENLERFINEVDSIHAELSALFEKRGGMAFMVFHPSWGYFARTYGIVQVPVEIEGKTPKPAQMKALIDRAKKQHIKVIFVQPQFSKRSAGVIAKSIGGQVMVADPLAYDWAGNIRHQAGVFEKVLAP